MLAIRTASFSQWTRRDGMLHAWARVMLHERTPTVGALLLRNTYVWLTPCSPTTKHRVLSHRCGDYRKEPSLTASQDPDSRGAHFRFMTRSLRALRKASEASSSPTVTQRERSCASLNLHPCFSPHLTSFSFSPYRSRIVPQFPCPTTVRSAPRADRKEIASRLRSSARSLLSA